MSRPESWIKLLGYPCQNFTADEVAQIIMALAKIYKHKISLGDEPRLVGHVVENGTAVKDTDAVEDVLALLQS